ncbi:Protein mlo3-like protein (RNA recognition domain-containing protein), partial [Colletotrichum plurivorum]
EYFLTSVGPIKRVEISYGPNSVSRGIANITFRDSDGASKAFQKLNGLLVDNRPIKIEIVVGASQAANVIPPKKTLAERTSQPKAQPKSAANDKRNGNANKGAANAGARGKKPQPRRARSGRPAKKTAEELDSEMADYFDSAATGNNENAAAPAPAAANGDAPMEDEIM